MMPLRAGFGRFLWLWLPSIVVFIFGLRRAFLTGQTDPWDWILPMAVVLVVIGLLIARRGWTMLVWVALGSSGMALIFCALAAGRVPDGLAAAGVLAVASLASFGGAFLRCFPFGPRLVGRAVPDASRLRSKRAEAGVGLLLLIFAALICWRGPAHPIRMSPDRPALAVITALPLFWDEAGQGGPRDAPIVTLLRTRFTVMPMDDPLRLASSGVKRLLLAQPRAMSPAQRVAIDQWVRNGGTVLVLDDPLLRWTSDLPLGDRRRAPSVGLLHPLLAHWGFRPHSVWEKENRTHLPGGHVITLSGTQLFVTGPEGRIAGADESFVHRKRLGSGEMLLLGDADPIDDRLWLADPAHPLDPRLWIADTPAQLVHWLGGAPVPGDRRWMQAAQDVQGGIRWAVLAGIIWAMMGAGLLRPERRGFGPGTKGEDDGIKYNKSG